MIETREETCPTEEEMFAFLDGELDAEEQVRFLRHLAHCEECRQALAAMIAMLDEVSATLRCPSEDEMPVPEAWAAVSEAVSDGLRAFGLIRSRKKTAARATAGRLMLGAAKAARVTATAAWNGTKVLYTGLTAVSRFAAGAKRITGRIAGRSLWRLAW